MWWASRWIRNPRPRGQRRSGGRGGCGARGSLLLREGLVEAIQRRVLGDVEREGELAHEDLTGLHEHRLLTGREALVGVAQGEVPDDLGHLVHVAGLQLLLVVLEAARPVGG